MTSLSFALLNFLYFIFYYYYYLAKQHKQAKGLKRFSIFFPPPLPSARPSLSLSLSLSLALSVFYRFYMRQCPCVTAAFCHRSFIITHKPDARAHTHTFVCAKLFQSEHPSLSSDISFGCLCASHTCICILRYSSRVGSVVVYPTSPPLP